jgi:hypothetical protein
MSVPVLGAGPGPAEGAESPMATRVLIRVSAAALQQRQIHALQQRQLHALQQRQIHALQQRQLHVLQQRQLHALQQRQIHVLQRHVNSDSRIISLGYTMTLTRTRCQSPADHPSLGRSGYFLH